MRTRSSSNLVGESSPNRTTSNPKHRNNRRSKQPFILEESPVDTMADQCTMAELLRAPTEGCAEAIVVPPILDEHFELKHSLINMMTSDQFFGLEKDNPHDHIRWFNKITSTIKYNDVPNSAIKLMLFLFSLAGAARRWLKKEPPHSILTWKDLVSKFINELFPPSRTTNLRNEISNFQQRFDESFHEEWDCYKDLLRACPHHGFTKLHQLDTFYNVLNPANQDSLNSAAGGNLLERRTQDVLTIIKNKSRFHNSRNKSIVSQVKSSDGNSFSSSEIAKLTHVVNQQTSAVTTAMTAILKQFQANPPPAFVKAIEEICFTCGRAHPYYQCLAADGNTFPEFRDTIQGYVSTAAVNYNQGNSGYRPPSVANQIRPPSFAQPNVQNNQNRFSQTQGYTQGNNFNQDTSYQAPIQQNQVVPLSELEKIKKINEINMKAMQTQINNVKNELRNEMKTLIQASMSNQTNELKNMMTNFFQMNIASTSGSGPLPSNTIANPKGELKAITTRSGLVLDGPSVLMPHPFINPEEDERAEETLTDPELAEYTIKDKIKESKLLIDELDPSRSSEFLPSLKYDSVLYEDFYEVDALPSTNNEDKVFNPGVLIHENISEVTIRVTPYKNVKKISISNASLISEDFNPPLYELPFHKEVFGSETLLSFSSENKENVFKPGILTSKGVHTSLLPELSHRGPKDFKVIKIFESSMEIFPCSYGEDIRILDVSCLHFYPP
nr:reverse transcriptase domain-containing protein [Tanacetum cinerariifolium]